MKNRDSIRESKQLAAVDGAGERDSYAEAISQSGLRFTPQRRHVYDLLMGEQNHPTATEVFLRAKNTMPHISLATVYNCLETLVDCGLVRQVHIDREPTRYCANLARHGHFVCSGCGRVHDVRCDEHAGSRPMWKLPRGFTVTSVEINLRGLCAECNAAQKS